MTEATRPHPHSVGNYAKHSAWQPVDFALPDDPTIGIFVTNVAEHDKAVTMRAYYALHPEAEFSVGPPKGTKHADAATLKKANIVGIYANRKRTNG